MIRGTLFFLSLCFTVLSASGLQSGHYTYELINGGAEVAITDYPTAHSGAITVPDLIDGKPVTMIGGDAFYFCRDLTEIYLPSTITAIGVRAFYNCDRLTSMELPSSVVSLSSYAFYNCSSITNFTLSSAIPKIYEYTFYNCSKLKTLALPPISTIGPSAFEYCRDLTAIVIPDSVSQMGPAVFKRCGELSSISLSQNLISIPKDAFYACGDLRSITIPNSVSLIDDGAFKSCWGLNTVVISNSVTSIGPDAFQSCHALASMHLPESVHTLGQNAFKGCYSLTNIHLSAAITRLETATFSGCSSLPVLNISSNVTYLGGSLFENCSSLSAVHIDASNSVYGSLDGVVLNAGLTDLLYYPPNKADALYTVPDSVTTISTGGFASGTNLNSVLISASVNTIGAYAFDGSSALTDVLFEGDAPSVFGADVFRDTDPAFSILYMQVKSGFSTPSWQGYPAQPLDLFTYQFINGNAEVEITGYPSGASGALVIPSYIRGKPVTSIGNAAFQDSTSLTSIVFPERLIAIGDDAFAGCLNLTEITLPSTLVSIGDNAFGGCSLLSGAHFEGNAPSVFGGAVFLNTDAEFEITYTIGASGFTTPIWQGQTTYPRYIFERPGQIGTEMSFAKPFVAATGNDSLGLKSDGSIIGWGLNNNGQNNVTAPNADFQAVVTGFKHALGLKRDGTVVGWGSNSLGQRYVPLPNTNFISIAAGGYFSLGIKSDGSLVPWGNNNFDQREIPSANSNYVAVAVGNNHAVGLKSDGTIVGWGDGAREIPGVNSNFVAVTAGGEFALGLKSDGSIVGWGNNSYGQTTVPSPNTNFVAVAAGYYHALGLKSDGSIVAWGNNDSGQRNIPLPNRDFVAINGGLSHSIGVKKDGSIVTWGGQTSVPSPNSGFYFSGVEPDAGPIFGGFDVTITGTDLCNGQIWDVTNVTLCGISAPVLRVSGSTQIVVQAASSLVETNGAVVVQSISNGTTTRENAFTYGVHNEIYFPAIETQRTLNSIDLYATASSGLPVEFDVLAGPAILNNETNLSFNSTGTVTVVAMQVGDANWDAAPWVTNTFKVAASRPGQIGSRAADLRNSIAGGQYHSMALKPDGAVITWGRNNYGQNDVPSPNVGFVALAGGNDHSLGLKPDGSIVGWGRNHFGQLTVPSPNASFVAMATGPSHSLGVKSDGSVYAWGKNNYGQSTVPNTNLNFIAVAAGESHSLALTSEGSIVAWGYDAWGQATAPVPNTNFVAIATGLNFSVGLKGDGTVVAWGNSSSGTTTVPSANSNFVAITAGEYHALGLKSDGSILGWGENGNSQLNVQNPNSDYIAVAAGGRHTLGLKSDGSIFAWGRYNEGQRYVPSPNAYAVAFAGVSPDLGPLEGGFNVTITGTSLCNGSLSDVTNVTLCGVSATVLSVSGSTQVVVQATASQIAIIGDVVVQSSSNGSTTKSNGFTYEKSDQTISFPTIGTNTTADTIDLIATATSGLPVSFSVVTGPAFIINGTTLGFSGTGAVSVVAMQIGTAEWNTAPSVTNTFEVIFGVYAAWSDAFGVVGTATDDDDNDGINNLLEYALNGNPTNGVNNIKVPKLGSILESAGTNWIQYIHVERTTSDHGLSYSIIKTSDLISPNTWTDVVDAVTLGVGPSIDEFRAVTNKVPMHNTSQEFFRLKVSK